MQPSKQIIVATDALFQELSALIDKSRQQLASIVNNTVSVLFWHIGGRIRTHVLQNKRAEYGKQIIATLSRQLSWSHFLVLLPIKNKEAKIFYAQMCAKEMWGVRELRKQIENKVYERKSLANIQLHQENDVSTMVFQDPYFLDF